MFSDVYQIFVQTCRTFFHQMTLCFFCQIVKFPPLHFIPLNGPRKLFEPVHLPRHAVREHEIRRKLVIDHRRQTQNLVILIADKCNIFIVIILIPFQNRNQNLHYQLLRHRRVVLEVVRFEDFGIIVEHLAVIDVIIDVNFGIWIFSKNFQQIQQMLSLVINHRRNGSIVIILFHLRLIPFTKRKPILRRRHKIRINHP